MGISNFVYLQEEEVSLGKHQKFQIIPKVSCLATTIMVSVLILASRELFYEVLVNWEPKNSNYGNAVILL